MKKNMSLTVTIVFLAVFLCSEISSIDITTSGSIPDPSRCTVPSDCVFPKICALCLQGYSPGCNQAECINGRCKIIQACSIKETTTTELCENDGQCPYPEYCAVECEQGLGPLCASAECIDGKCQTIAPCSRKTQCTDDDVSQCTVPQICAGCLNGYSPGCARATCKDGQCQIIHPCSIPPPTDSTTSLPGQCQTDGECSFVKQCVNECTNGLGPLCATGHCIGGQCVITLPCSQKPQCTENDVSQCAVPKICGLCKEGYSPACAQAVCENGQCRTIMPCTIYTDISTTTPTPGSACNYSSQCPRINDCVRKCPVGTSPRCTTAKCINGQCTYIKPCSQRPCQTRATCPYSKNNCVTCVPGYGPRCEQPACIGRICSIVPPCSNKLSIASNQ